LLSLVQGRRDDFIVVNGDLIPPTRVVPIFFSLDDIDAFQVIQENSKTLKVMIVKGKGFTDDTVETLSGRMRDVLGDSIEIIIEECNTLRGDRKKLRAVISHVRKD
jgi:phenylacetate-coenzyme A ligase PaaK-like adenylate-forming protein